jgi:hypothetical protein
MPKAVFISGFEKTGTERAVDLQAGVHDDPRNGLSPWLDRCQSGLVPATTRSRLLRSR